MKVVELDTGARNAIAFRAVCGEEVCGSLRAFRTTVRGRTVYTVARVDVSPEHQRKGIATRLYEAAHAEACRRRARLASTERNPGAHSNDFWRKQEARGRVEVSEGRFGPVYVVSSCETRDLSGWKKRRRP